MNCSPTAQAQLIVGCFHGNPWAQEQVFNMYAPKMLALISRYATDTMEAEDILMLGFTKVFDRISTYSASGSFEGWIRRIMINCALDVYHQNQRRIRTGPLDDVIDLQAHYPDDHTDIEYLLMAIQNLPICLRIPFSLFAIEGYSHREIAENLGISIVLSKVRVSRARSALQDRLSPILKKSHYAASAA